MQDFRKPAQIRLTGFYSYNLSVPIRSVAIMSKPRREEIREVVPSLVKWLRSHKVEVHLDQETSFTMTSAGPSFSRNEVPANVDLMLVLGGDGTLLAAARALQGRDIPLLAVNLGSLGFLTAVTLDEMYPSLEEVLAGKHQEDSRRMLMVELKRGGEARSEERRVGKECRL